MKSACKSAESDQIHFRFKKLCFLSYAPSKDFDLTANGQDDLNLCWVHMMYKGKFSEAAVQMLF